MIWMLVLKLVFGSEIWLCVTEVLQVYGDWLLKIVVMDCACVWVISVVSFWFMSFDT